MITKRPKTLSQYTKFQASRKQKKGDEIFHLPQLMNINSYFCVLVVITTTPPLASPPYLTTPSIELKILTSFTSLG